MPCKLCRERGKPWHGDDPRCAFETGVFSPENWNCATMNALRERARELGTTFRDDNAAGSIGCVPVETDDFNGYVVLVWYKDRGRTGNAILLCDDEPPRPLTEEAALAALRYSEWLLQMRGRWQAT